MSEVIPLTLEYKKILFPVLMYIFVQEEFKELLLSNSHNLPDSSKQHQIKQLAFKMAAFMFPHNLISDRPKNWIIDHGNRSTIITLLNCMSRINKDFEMLLGNIMDSTS